jgi:hypothetical protein
MNALKSIANRLAMAVVATGLVAGSAFAAVGSTLTVTLPEAVTVGGTTLAGGQYTITEYSSASGNSLFVFRSDKGDSATVVGTRTAEPAADQKTAVILSKEGGSLHVDKMFIEGEDSGFQFADSK